MGMLYFSEISQKSLQRVNRGDRGSKVSNVVYNLGPNSSMSSMKCGAFVFIKLVICNDSFHTSMRHTRYMSCAIYSQFAMCVTYFTSCMDVEINRSLYICMNKYNFTKASIWIVIFPTIFLKSI